MVPPLRIAIVGCGQIAVHHCAALAAVGGFEVVSLCDPSPERRRIILDIVLKQKSRLLPNDGAAPHEFESLDELLAKDDREQTGSSTPVIFIAVPHDIHEELVSKALLAGRHVILEKPLAPTIQGCMSLVAAATSADAMLVVAEQSPYWQEIVKARELLSAGAIGRLVSASSYYYESMRDNVTSGVDDDGSLGWRCSLKRCGGGIIIDGGLHWIRPLRVLCGDVDSVVAVARRGVEPGLQMEGETIGHALLRMSCPIANEMEDKESHYPYRKQLPEAGPLIATFSANMMHKAAMAYDSCPYFRLTGTSGELVVAGTGLNPDGGGGLRIYDDQSPGGREIFPAERHGGFFLGFEGMWRATADILRRCDRIAALKTVQDAAMDVAVALAMYKSSESGQWESCQKFVV